MTKGANRPTTLKNCKDDNCPCSVSCAMARAKGDKRPCRIIAIESTLIEMSLLFICTLSVLYYCYLKSK
jgi:hypothetical protein